MIKIPDSLQIEDEYLIGCLGSIGPVVKDLWKDTVLLHYTDHSITHSERIIAALGKLIKGNGVQLNEYERFILLASAYLHDIGMQSPTHAGLPIKVNYTYDEEVKIRELHNETSAKMITDSIKPGHQLRLGLEGCPRLAADIAKVCKYHRHLPLSELNDSTFCGIEVRIPLLTGLLRLGDELDADNRRIIMEVLKTRDIPIESKYHWWVHHYVRSVDIANGQITLRFDFPLQYEGNPLIMALRNRIVNSVDIQCFETAAILKEGYGLQLPNEIDVIEEYSESGQEIIPKYLEKYILRDTQYRTYMRRFKEDIQNSDPKVRWGAIHTIGSIRDKRATKSLVDALKNENDESVKSEALRALGRIYEKR
jgi:hypothetical protein